MCMEPLTLHFGDGRYMVGGYLLEESANAGICVYLNPNKSPALGQTDPDAIGKTTEEVGSILNLEFSNTQSIDVWISELNQVKKDLANQITGKKGVLAIECAEVTK